MPTLVVVVFVTKPSFEFDETTGTHDFTEHGEVPWQNGPFWEPLAWAGIYQLKVHHKKWHYDHDVRLRGLAVCALDAS
jgi:hypothetical protein